MKALTILRALGPIDLRNIRRDGALSWMIFLPVLSALALRWGLPPLTAAVLARYGFDLTPYTPVVLAYLLVLMTPVTFAVLIGFLLLDEKDDQTLTALQVTPLSLNRYLAYRLAVPVALTVALMFVIFPLAGLTEFDLGVVLVTAIAAAPTAPMFALFLASLAQNKVQGFALMKLSGVVLFAPVLAFFVEGPWSLAFGVVPTYWPVKVYWLMAAGEPGVWPYLAVALIYQSAVAALFIRRFNQVLHQ